MFYKIKEVSDMTGISVRMLHHYDKIGLLKPKNVSNAGYRLYTKDDVKKLSQILFYKELDFTLGEIKNILYSSNDYKIEVLKVQEKILAKKRDKIDALMKAVSKSIIALEQGDNSQDINIFTPMHLAEIDRNKEQLKSDLMVHLFTYSEEECGVKTSNYSKDDWTIVMSKADVILRKIYDRTDSGPEDVEVQNLIREIREFINNNLIKCDSSTFRLLGNLYVENPLYRNYAEQYSSSFPEFLKDAIEIYENINSGRGI